MRRRKIQAVDEIKGYFERAAQPCSSTYSGMTVAEVSALRRQFRARASRTRSSRIRWSGERWVTRPTSRS